MGNELWEIYCNEGRAINVSGVVNQDFINSNIMEYSGTIVDFLIKQRSCKNIHFHKTMNLPSRAHLELFAILVLFSQKGAVYKSYSWRF